MSDIHSIIKSKTDLITSIVALTGIPTPFIYWNWAHVLDETAKVAAIIYSVVGTTWVLIQWYRSRK